MKVKKVKIKNFRLLKDVTLSLEDKTTVIVGRNNSGKTSLTEIFRRFFSGNTPVFQLEDFTIDSLQGFKNAYITNKEDKNDESIRENLPNIELTLYIDYSNNKNDYAILGEFIIDLDENLTETIIKICYQLEDGMIHNLFEEITSVYLSSEKCTNFQLKSIPLF